MMFFQLRICPKGEPTQDYGVIAGALPRIGETITAPDGRSYVVKYVNYEFEAFNIETSPQIIVVARAEE